MKANVFGMLMKLTAISAVFNCVLLSAAAAEIPLSPSEDIEITPALARALSNETITKDEAAAAATTTIASTKTSDNASVEGSGDETRPPLEFPEEEKLPSNKTLVKILQDSSSQGVKSSEDTKLTNSSTIEVTVSTTQVSSVETTSLSSQNVTAPSLNETTEGTSNSTTSAQTEEDYEDGETGKSDSENIQDTIEQQQDELEEQFARNGSDKATINVFEDPVTNQPLHGGHVALIFASTLIIFSVLAYVGLILWRSRLEARYGMRQRLVTEDVFYSDNQNDTRYFGL